MNVIFVYGLLKPGLRLYHVVEPFVTGSAPATVSGRLYDAGVPAARFDHDGHIEGFVFTLDEPRLDEALRVLDELEDEGADYDRIVVSAVTDEGPVEAHAYQWRKSLDGCPDVGPSWPGSTGLE